MSKSRLHSTNWYCRYYSTTLCSDHSSLVASSYGSHDARWGRSWGCALFDMLRRDLLKKWRKGSEARRDGRGKRSRTCSPPLSQAPSVSRRARGAEDGVAAGSKLPPVALGRRKLVDEVMAGFLIGNTAARAVMATEDVPAPAPSASGAGLSPVRLLFCGVGDVRNALTTAEALQPGVMPRPIEVHLNDISVATLARDAVLLHLAVSAGAAVSTAVWSDAQLAPAEGADLRASLRALCEARPPPWLVFPPAENDAYGTLAACRECWRAWLEMEPAALVEATLVSGATVLENFDEGFEILREGATERRASSYMRCDGA